MKVVIMGAGPAGLSAAYTLTQNSVEAVVLEMDSVVGGIARTVAKDGFRFDLGGHRFFSKNEELNELLRIVMGDELIDVPRISKIFFNGKYFDYPLQPKNALFGMGVVTTFEILVDYVYERLRNIKNKPQIITLEDWVVNQFGRKMFELYFKTYTEKVWGIPCHRIEAEWVAQRIKGLSLKKAIRNALMRSHEDIPTTLISRFKYPRLGIGRICERLREETERRNRVLVDSRVIKVTVDRDRVVSVEYRSKNGGREVCKADEFISSIPITELIQIIDPPLPSQVIEASKRLRYRDLITVNLMVDKERVTENTWIYMHAPEIGFGRIHEPKNWSKEMAKPNKTSLVMEYFCFKDDHIWRMDDEELIELTKMDLISKLGFVNRGDVIDGFVIRTEKAYPMYEIGYKRHLETIMEYIQGLKNLQVIGRYGMYRYNNMDHSMETGIKAAKNLLGEEHDVYQVNIQQDYHEEVS